MNLLRYATGSLGGFQDLSTTADTAIRVAVVEVSAGFSVMLVVAALMDRKTDAVGGFILANKIHELTVAPETRRNRRTRVRKYR